MNPEAAIKLLRTVGYYGGLVTYDHCGCGWACVQAINLDVSCHGSGLPDSKGWVLRVWSTHSDRTAEGLRAVADVFLELIRPWTCGEILVRFCSWEADNKKACDYWVVGQFD